MNIFRCASHALFARGALACLLLISAVATAQPAPPTLGTTAPFAVLGGSTVTNTGPTTVIGELGVSPGTAVIGFPPGVVTNGTIHSADAVAAQAQVDLTTAYNDLAGRPCNTTLTGQDLGGLTLVPGVYCFATSAQLTGDLRLDAQGNPNAVFIFKIGSTLTTASASRVLVINGGTSCNVFWQVGSSATLGTTTTFAGNILALTSITLVTGANVSGRLLARNGAVTLGSNSVAVCGGGGQGCPNIVISPSVLPAPAAGVAYSQTLTASGGTAPYTFVGVGTLPAGLTFTTTSPTTALISGTPTVTGGSSTFTVTATDSAACFASVVLGLQQGVGPLSIPLLSPWGMLLLGSLLALGAMVFVRTRSLPQRVPPR